MNTFDEVVWCKTQEEWDAVIDWTDYSNGREAKRWFTEYDNPCIRCNITKKELHYGSKKFYKQEMEGSNGLQIPDIISFQQFKEKYMQHQSPSESVKVKSDGGISMEGSHVKLLKQNIISFINSVESVGCSPSVLLAKNIELLEVLSRNGLKLTLTKEN